MQLADIAGRRTVLFGGRQFASGEHSVDLLLPRALSSGVYFVQRHADPRLWLCDCR